MTVREIKLPNEIVQEIMHSLRHILLNQSSIAIDYIEEEFEDWNRTDIEFIKNCLECEEMFLKELVIPYEANN